MQTLRHSGLQLSAPVKEGDVLAGKYRVERVLGEGGMGIVVAATHLDLDQKVALKFLLPDALAHPEIIERFAREARAVAKIRSQHVVRVIDTGKMENGTPFMVMEYLEGKDLSGLLEAEGRLAIEAAVDYVLQACEAMAEAHAVGIVHRDLKPANLFLAKQPDRRSIVKVLDFGISKVADPKSSQLTRTATMMGSPHYMSPEQLTSTKHVDARADIWALGVILYELVSGQRPYEAESMPEIVARILGNTPVPLAELRAEIPPGLAAVIMRCLASKIDQRFETVADLANALTPYSSDTTHSAAAASRMSRVLGPSVRPPSTTRDAGSGAAATSSMVQTAPARPGAVRSDPESGRVEVHAGASRDAAHIQTQMASEVGSPVRASAPGRTKWIGAAATIAIALGGLGIFVAMRAKPHADGAANGSIGTDVTTSATAATTAAPKENVPVLPAVLPPASAALPTIPEAPATAAASTTPAAQSKPIVKHVTAPKPAVAAPATTPTPAQTPEKKNPLDMGIK